MLLTIWQQKSNSKSALHEDVQRQVVDVKRHGGALGDASLRDATRRARLTRLAEPVLDSGRIKRAKLDPNISQAQANE